MGVKPGLQVSDAGGVRRIVLDRPERRNAVDTATAAALHEAVLEVREDESCRVVVLAGTGPAFCAGWDFESLAELRSSSPGEVRAELERGRRLLHDLAAAPQVTVAAVHGPVLGFGLGLLAGCDIAVAARGATIGLPEIALGVVPGMVMLDVLNRVPEKVALDWLLSGEKRTAEEGLAAGLFSRVVDDDELEETVTALAARLVGHDSYALRETKRMFRRLSTLDRAAAEDEAIAAAAAALLRG